MGNELGVPAVAFHREAFGEFCIVFFGGANGLARDTQHIHPVVIQALNIGELGNYRLGQHRLPLNNVEYRGDMRGKTVNFVQIKDVRGTCELFDRVREFAGQRVEVFAGYRGGK